MKEPRVYPVFHGPDDNVITDKGCEFLTTSVNSVAKLQWLVMDNIQASIHSINAILLLKPKQTGGSDTANVINNTFIDIGKCPQL
uniref:Uncharacterized protein n=1 Tax=Glossina palpalis gambiensis TaxID=67801 RepID=A0A1B0BM52_9MUSC